MVAHQILSLARMPVPPLSQKEAPPLLADGDKTKNTSIRQAEYLPREAEQMASIDRAPLSRPDQDKPHLQPKALQYARTHYIGLAEPLQ